MHAELLKLIIDFEWDDWNRRKSLIKHDVPCDEAQEVFTNSPLILLDDIRHSEKERRYHAFGVSNNGRHLLICFTVRRQKIRVISARPMNKKERDFYEKENT
jgi:uncharacterized DUF497 family protein